MVVGNLTLLANPLTQPPRWVKLINGYIFHFKAARHDVKSEPFSKVNKR
jgi:hypothetical protein